MTSTREPHSCCSAQQIMPYQTRVTYVGAEVDTDRYKKLERASDRGTRFGPLRLLLHASS
jgi:hypothetical protein